MTGQGEKIIAPFKCRLTAELNKLTSLFSFAQEILLGTIKFAGSIVVSFVLGFHERWSVIYIKKG